MIFEDNYKEYLEDTYELLENRNIKTGFQAQCNCLYDTDESSLTERERLIMMLPVIKWEVENDVLTPELKDELELYYEEVTEGKFDNLLGEDEVEAVKHDLFECYEKVFENK